MNQWARLTFFFDLLVLPAWTYSTAVPAPSPCCPDRSSHAEIKPISYLDPSDGNHWDHPAADGSAPRRPGPCRNYVKRIRANKSWHCLNWDQMLLTWCGTQRRCHSWDVPVPSCSAASSPAWSGIPFAARSICVDALRRRWSSRAAEGSRVAKETGIQTRTRTRSECHGCMCCPLSAARSRVRACDDLANCWSDDPIDEPRIWSVKMRKRGTDKKKPNKSSREERQTE